MSENSVVQDFCSAQKQITNQTTSHTQFPPTSTYFKGIKYEALTDKLTVMKILSYLSSSARQRASDITDSRVIEMPENSSSIDTSNSGLPVAAHNAQAVKKYI